MNVHNTQSLIIPGHILKHKHYPAWMDYHLANRHVIRRILEELMKSKQTGRQTSVKAIINKLRWSDIETSGREFKISDAYTSIYGHIIYNNFPEYRSVFSIKTLKN